MSKEFTAKVEITVVKTGCMMRIMHPARGDTPEYTEIVVFQSLLAAQAKLAELFEQYAIDSLT